MAAVRSHPLTAPYPITVTAQKGKVILAGRVGTKQVHDTAVRLVIATGVPFRDDLVIDTAGPPRRPDRRGGGLWAATARRGLASSPYIYPPPLFGRLDDPFFGCVPPLVSFPPWWSRGIRRARRWHRRSGTCRSRPLPGPPRPGGGRPISTRSRGRSKSMSNVGSGVLRGTVASEDSE